MNMNETAARQYMQYIIRRAAYYGYTYTMLAAELRMSTPTLRKKLQGASQWRESEIRRLTFTLNLSAEEAAALGIFRAIPHDTVGEESLDAGEAWGAGCDGWPLEEPPEFIPFGDTKATE